MSLSAQQKQIVQAITILLFLVLLFWNSSSFLLMPFLIVLIPFALILGFSNPSYFCLIFLTFSLFRIQGLIPILLRLQIPFISAVLSLLSLVYNIILHKVKLFWRPEMTYFILFFIQVTIGVLLSYNFSEAIDAWTITFSKIAIIFFLIVWCIRTVKDFKLINIITILCGTIISLFTLYNKYNGLGLIAKTRATAFVNSDSYISDPNDLAFTLLIPFSFSCALFFIKSNHFLTRLIGLGSSLIVITSIIATQSRGGILGLVCVLIFFFGQRIKSIIPIIFLSISLVACFYFISNITERQTFNEQGQLDESSQGRIFAWKAAINMAIHHPIFGVGLSGFTPNFPKYALGSGNTGITTHSSWFLVLSESGFVGFFLFIMLIYMAIKNTYFAIKQIEVLNAYKTQNSVLLTFSYGLLASFIGYCVSGSFLSQGFSWPIYILLPLSITLSYNVTKLLKSDK